MPEELLDEGNALGYIRAEHERIKALFATVLDNDDIELRRQSLQLLLGELRVHSRMEQELFMPYAQSQLVNGGELIDRNMGHLRDLDGMQNRFHSVDPASADFHTSFGELVRNFQHHVYEIEQFVLLGLEGGDYQRHNELVLIARRMRAMREEFLASLKRPHEVAPGVQGTEADLKLRKAQQQGRNLDPERDIVPSRNEGERDLTVTTEGDVVNMGDKSINLERGDEGRRV
jgi:hypothetical protein